MASYWIRLFICMVLFNDIFFETFASFDSISLYNANDKVVVLTTQNFSSTIDGSETAWLVKFYASWCGHCQTYANTYRGIAIDAWGWKSVVRFAAINCYGDERDFICHRHGIHHYPTLVLIPPRSIFNNSSKLNSISPEDLQIVEQHLIKALERMRRKHDLWPHFTPLNRITLEEMYARAPKKVRLVLIIVEKRLDLTGRQTMLDFSNYSQQLSIFRTTTDGRLWRKFGINATEIPALFVLLRNRTVQRIPLETNLSKEFDYRTLFHRAIRSYIERTQVIPNFDDHDWEERILSKNALKSAEEQQKLRLNRTASNDDSIQPTIDQPLNTIDLELALYHMFHQEIPSMKSIEGESYQALVHWLEILTKYFPGRHSVMLFLQQLLDKVQRKSTGFSGDEFFTMVQTNDPNVSLPNYHNQYQTCAGSAPQYRGYPCSLWLLFHTLTVAQVNLALSYRSIDDSHLGTTEIDVIEIPMAIRNYIQHYFACRECSRNFLKETNDINHLNRTNPFEAIEYLWKVHNSVNHRLHGDITEDPEHPKVQYPSRSQCPLCRSNDSSSTDVRFHLVKTRNFLLRFYSKENIDTSMHLPSIIPTVTHHKRISHSNRKIIPNIPWYFVVVLLVFIFFYRRRSCREKRPRYTL